MMKIPKMLFFLCVCVIFVVYKLSNSVSIRNQLRFYIDRIPDRSAINIKLIEPTEKTGKTRLTNATVIQDVHTIEKQNEPDIEVSELTGQQMSKRSSSKYRIVLYNFYHGLLKSKATNTDMTKCSVFNNCEVSKQIRPSNEPIDAEAIVFQGNHMPVRLPSRQNSDQVFVYVNIESPQYLQTVDLTGSKLQDFFNWTMSYRFDSDIPYLYGSIIPKNISKHELLSKSEVYHKIFNYRDFPDMTTQWPNKYDGKSGKNYEAIFDRKTKSSVWFVSHCTTASKREEFVEEMKKFTNVDIFGKCSQMKNICPKGKKNCSTDIEATYKFVLAFENSLCEDYITEKVFGRYNLDLITVVLGAHNYSKYLPKGTYIDANHFANPEELAEYLNYVGSTKEVYLDYLKLKDQYKTISEKEHVQLAYCTLCYRLNKLNEYRKPGSPLQHWWNRPGICRKSMIMNSKPKQPLSKGKEH